MSEFKFNLGASSAPRRAFRVGFSAEVETVNGWNGAGWWTIQPIFITIPSGPVLVSGGGPSLAGGTIKIAESADPWLVLQWLTVDGNGFQGTGVKVRTINVPAGAEYSAYHSISGPFVAMIVNAVDEFAVEAVGIPERAPATMLKDPNPYLVGGM